MYNRRSGKIRCGRGEGCVCRTGVVGGYAVRRGEGCVCRQGWWEDTLWGEGGGSVGQGWWEDTLWGEGRGGGKIRCGERGGGKIRCGERGGGGRYAVGEGRWEDTLWERGGVSVYVHLCVCFLVVVSALLPISVECL